MKCWQECAAFTRSTAGNDVVATIFIIPSPTLPHFFSFIATYSHRRSARIKKLIQRKLLRMPKNLGVATFPDPINHFGFCRQCSVAGGERVSPSPLGWYNLIMTKIILSEYRGTGCHLSGHAVVSDWQHTSFVLQQSHLALVGGYNLHDHIPLISELSESRSNGFFVIGSLYFFFEPPFF